MREEDITEAEKKAEKEMRREAIIEGIAAVLCVPLYAALFILFIALWATA